MPTHTASPSASGVGGAGFNFVAGSATSAASAPTASQCPASRQPDGTPSPTSGGTDDRAREGRRVMGRAGWHDSRCERSDPDDFCRCASRRSNTNPEREEFRRLSAEVKSERERQNPVPDARKSGGMVSGPAPDVQARVTEVLSKHTHLVGLNSIICDCGWQSGLQPLGVDIWKPYLTHVAAVLAEAGLLADRTGLTVEPVIHDHIGGTKRQRVKALEADVQTLLDRCSYLRQQLDATRAELLVQEHNAELAEAKVRIEGAVAALREAVDLIAGGPAYRLPPSVIIALLRERADHIEGEIHG